MSWLYVQVSMLPSRGLRLSHRVYSPQSRYSRPTVVSRNISTRSRLNAPISTRWQPQCIGSSRPISRTRPSGIVGVSQIRFASTAPATINALPSSPAISTATPVSSTSEVLADSAPVVTSTSLDTLEFSNIGSTNITEHLGYLKELGLNFGWGPTSMMQWYYEHIHVLSGLPWWSSILLASFLYRVGVLAYPNLITSDQMARLKSITPYMKAIQTRQREEYRKADQQAMMKTQREVALLKKSAGVSFSKQFALIGIQTFLGYGTFKLMREMAQLPVPGLESQGIGWIHDLTVPDPYFILPIALAGTMHLVFKLGGPGGGGSEFAPPNADMAAATGYMRTALLYGMPAAIGFFMLWMPACLQLSFASTSVFGMVQGRLMLKPWFRQAFGLWPLESPPPPLFGSPQGQQGGDVGSKTMKNLSTSATMAGYQAPTVEAVARSIPASSKAKRGVFGTLTRPLSPLVRFFSGFWKEARDTVAQRRGKKSAARESFEEKAKAHEQRRRRELEEDRRYRERMRKEGRQTR